MYKLENNVEWTENLKNAFKHGITRGKIKYTNDNNQEVVIDYNNGLKSFKLYDEKNVPSQGFIGQATARQVDLELINTININNLENKEFELFLGADYNNQTYYINYGKFIVNQAPENDLTNGIIKITAFDYMIKANIPYVPVVTFPCTLKAVVDDICAQTGLELATLDFANADFIVDSNQFDGKTCREVLCHVAKCAFSWVRIGQDNKLYIDYEVKDLLDFKLAEIDGDTFQQSYTGKNLLNRTTCKENKTFIWANGNDYNSDNCLLSDFMSVSNLTDIASNYKFFIAFYNSSKTYLGNDTDLRTSTGISRNKINIANVVNNHTDITYFKLTYKPGDNNRTNMTTVDIMLNTGTTALDYEPYTGNQPAPNPDYPQDVQVVTGNNNIKIENKNLYNYNEIYYYRNNYQDYVTVTTNNNNITIVNNQSGGNGAVLWNIPVEIGENITISYSDMIETNASTSNCIQYDFSDELVTSFSTIPGNMIDKTLKKISITATKKYLNLILRTGNGNSYTISDLMVEYGNQATTYIAHQEQNFPITLGNIELAKIGNYQDKIIKKSDGWYKRAEIGKVTFNGTENDWQRGSTNTSGLYRFINGDIKDIVRHAVNNNEVALIYSNIFKAITPNNTSQNITGLSINTTGYVVVYSDDTSQLSVTNFKAWLSTNNIILYYVLTTPTETKITDATLINQLNALYNAKLYEGKNYIILQAEANNLTGTYIFNTNRTKVIVLESTSIDTSTYDMADKITIEDYYQDKFKTANEMYGAINRVVYADSNIQGQEEKVEDTDDIAINGVHELTIYDNYFAYTTEKRQQLIQAGTRLFGMKYMPIQQLEMVGLAYLDCNDILEATSPDNNKFPILPLNHIIEYNGAVKDSLTLETNSTTETNYKNTNAPINANSLTEIIVDRAMREIKMIVDQYVNFLHNKSGNNNIFIDGTRDGEGFITKFVIKGNTTYFTENTITLITSEVVKNEEIAIMTEADDSLLTEAGDVILGEPKTLYVDKVEIVLDDVLRSLVVDNTTYYDELQILQDGTIQIIRRIGVSTNQTLYLLDKEKVTILNQKYIVSSSEKGYYYFVEELDNLDYYAEYIIKNEYSDVYATEAYVNAGLDLKIDTNKLVSELNASADIIKLIGQRLIIQMQNFSLDETGYMSANAGQIAGFTMLQNRFYKDFDMLYEFTRQDALLLAGALNGYNTLTSGIHDLYNLYGSSSLTVQDLVAMLQIMNGAVENTKKMSGTISIKSNNCNELIEITNTSNIPKTRFGVFSIYSYLLSADVVSLVDEIDNSVVVKGIVLDRAKRQISVTDVLNETHITTTILPTGITTPTLTQTSRADDKKDFEKMENALDEVMNTDIYTYHLKSQNEDDKKHVGFVIGDGFKYSHLITAENDKKEEIGVEPYSMVSVLWKAVQEQQAQIEELKKEIKKLKGE